MDESEVVKYSLTAHHGTNKAAKSNILALKHFNQSNTDSEWAGTGVYFFIDYTSVTVSRNNAVRWAGKIKKFASRDIAVIEANIEYIEDEIFNIRDDEAKKIFHRYREAAFRAAINKIDKYNATRIPGTRKKILSSQYRETKKFDCLVFNEICKQFNIKAVIRDAYINFEHDAYPVHFVSSDIPNCIVLCVKDESIIKELK